MRKLPLSRRRRQRETSTRSREWDELSKKVDEVTATLKPWAEKYTNGELSDADKSYYMKVVVPAASKSANAGLELLDLVEL